jgi:hypothetical protein
MNRIGAIATVLGVLVAFCMVNSTETLSAGKITSRIGVGNLRNMKIRGGEGPETECK